MAQGIPLFPWRLLPGIRRIRCCVVDWLSTQAFRRRGRGEVQGSLGWDSETRSSITVQLGEKIVWPRDRAWREAIPGAGAVRIPMWFRTSWEGGDTCLDNRYESEGARGAIVIISVYQ